MTEKSDNELDRLLFGEFCLKPVDNSVIAEAVEEILKLRAECQRLAGYLMHEYVFVHERLTEELDEVLKPYLGS